MIRLLAEFQLSALAKTESVGEILVSCKTLSTLFLLIFWLPIRLEYNFYMFKVGSECPISNFLAQNNYVDFKMA